MIPVSSRSGSRYRRVVFIREGARELYVGSPEERGAQWRDLAPANHRLTFTVAGAGFGKSVEFTQDVSLERHQILIAWCYTTYSAKPFNRNPRPNQWYVGVVNRTPG
jgi:hypothetical protein